MEQIGAISTLALMPTNKNEAKNFSGIFLAELEQGNLNPIEWAKKLKAIKDCIKLIEEGHSGLQGLTEASLNAAVKDVHNESFDIANVTRYDYSQCCDFEWDWYENKIKEFREYQKEREAKLRLVRYSEIIEYTNPSTGSIEMNKVFAPIKKTTEYLKFNG